MKIAAAMNGRLSPSSLMAGVQNNMTMPVSNGNAGLHPVLAGSSLYSAWQPVQTV
jgi:hypothetical protein